MTVPQIADAERDRKDKTQALVAVVAETATSSLRIGVAADGGGYEDVSQVENAYEGSRSS